MHAPWPVAPHRLAAVYLQVIEDSVAVVAHVRKQHAVPKATPNIVVGGSYGKSLQFPAGQLALTARGLSVLESGSFQPGWPAYRDSCFMY